MNLNWYTRLVLFPYIFIHFHSKRVRDSLQFLKYIRLSCGAQKHTKFAFLTLYIPRLVFKDFFLHGNEVPSSTREVTI